MPTFVVTYYAEAGLSIDVEANDADEAVDRAEVLIADGDYEMPPIDWRFIDVEEDDA